MTWPDAILRAAALGLLTANALYPGLAFLLLRRWPPAPPDAGADLPPVTFLRPLKAAVPALRLKLDALAAALRPGDQLILGADRGSLEAGLAEEVRAAFPAREILVVACAAGAALNPKISKLVQMTPHARHPHWILSDSEGQLDAAWLDAFRHEWLAGGADVLTAGYRFANLATWPQRLDAAAALLALWPGLAILRHRERIHFTLGACTGLRRDDLAAVGGWAAFGDFLAEDNRLGAALAQAGRTIRLSTHVATLDSDPLTWRDYWRHQRRVAVTYRVCHPAGFAGMILTNAWVGFLAWALLVGLSSPARVWPGLVLLHIVRWLLSRGLAQRLHFPIPGLFFTMLAASAVELVCWFAAWGNRRVWWAGRRWQVSPAGRLTPL